MIFGLLPLKKFSEAKSSELTKWRKKLMKKFVYFVSFTDGISYGNGSVVLDHPITTDDDIKNIEKVFENQLENQCPQGVILLNFQFLREDE